MWHAPFRIVRLEGPQADGFFHPCRPGTVQQHEILVCLHRLGVRLRILDMARSPRYFTAETVGSCHTCTRFEGEARLQLHPNHLGPVGHISQAPGSLTANL